MDMLATTGIFRPFLFLDEHFCISDHRRFRQLFREAAEFGPPHIPAVIATFFLSHPFARTRSLFLGIGANLEPTSKSLMRLALGFMRPPPRYYGWYEHVCLASILIWFVLYGAHVSKSLISC